MCDHEECLGCFLFLEYFFILVEWTYRPTQHVTSFVVPEPGRGGEVPPLGRLLHIICSTYRRPQPEIVPCFSILINAPSLVGRQFDRVCSFIHFGCIFFFAQERNGYLPPAKDPDWKDRLKQVYGSMPAHLTPEYKKTDRYITQVKVREKKNDYIMAFKSTDVMVVVKYHERIGRSM